MTEPQSDAKRTRERKRRSRTDLAVRWAEFGFALTSLIVAIAALVTSAAVFFAGEHAEGPIIEVAADNGTQVEWTVDGKNVGGIEYQVLVLVNRGRTAVDVLRVMPLDMHDTPMGERVFFSEEYCDRPGHATIPAGGTLVVVSWPSSDDAPYAWDVLLATGTQTVKLERKGTSSDPANISDSYADDAHSLIETCAPDLIPPEVREDP